MKARQIVYTGDGSTSLFVPEWNEHYHSTHGAIQEAYHVFIQNGLFYFDKKKLRILEIGLGTGLNCFISFLEAKKNNYDIAYTGVEAYPITREEYRQLNYVERLEAKSYQSVFEFIHTSDWHKKITLADNFTLIKRAITFQNITCKNSFDLIYFDAFAPGVQPELWTESIFKKMYDALSPGGVLVTYSAKGSVRRTMQSLGFQVEKLPGPPGKREMLRAIKSKKTD